MLLWTKERVKRTIANGNPTNQALFDDIWQTIYTLENSKVSQEKYWKEICEIMKQWECDYIGITYKKLYERLSVIRWNIAKDEIEIENKNQKMIKKYNNKKQVKHYAIKLAIWLSGTIVTALIATIVGLWIGGKI